MSMPPQGEIGLESASARIPTCIEPLLLMPSTRAASRLASFHTSVRGMLASSNADARTPRAPQRAAEHPFPGAAKRQLARASASARACVLVIRTFLFKSSSTVGGLVDPNEKSVPLSKGEYALLLEFLEASGRPLGREHLKISSIAASMFRSCGCGASGRLIRIRCE